MNETSSTQLEALQALLDRSTASASPAVADSVAFPSRQMSAAEFLEFWNGVKIVAMATVGARSEPHLAPVHTKLSGTTLKMVVYDNTIRRSDLARNPRVAFTTWRDDGATAIVYGRAREVAGSMRDARPGRSGKPRRVVELEVSLTRVYAMRAPERAKAESSS